MNHIERKFLDKLDEVILTASEDELKKIQETDKELQLKGISYFDAFMNSDKLKNYNIKQGIKK